VRGEGMKNRILSFF